MRIFFTVLSFIALGSATGQATIQLNEVSKHIGDSVTVCGKVAGLRYFENSKNQPTFLNIGANFPDQKLTVVIWGEVRKLFTGKVEDFKDRQVCITGRIILYKERPEIIIYRPDQVIMQ